MTPNSELPAAGAELVAVSIGDNLFAIDIMAVREIRGWSASTPLPHAPANVLGMINLRGLILPVIDLGATLGLGPTQAQTSSVVVVVQSGEQQVGLMVDAVCDILTLSENALQPPPDIGGQVKEYVLGVINTGEAIVSLLSLRNVLPATYAAAA